MCVCGACPCLMMLCGNIWDSCRERGNKRDDSLAWGLFFLPSLLCELERIKGNNKSLHYVTARTAAIISFVVLVRRNLQDLEPASTTSHKSPTQPLNRESDQFPAATFGHNSDGTIQTFPVEHSKPGWQPTCKIQPRSLLKTVKKKNQIYPHNWENQPVSSRAQNSPPRLPAGEGAPCRT